MWLDDLPVATLRPTGSGSPTPVAVYYVHADHLGSPRAITRPSDDQIVWRWDNADPFGDSAAEENPAGLGSFRYDLRFPGQYYDAETGTHYNYFRDYDPAIGRYSKSDPVGLLGGVNTYAYVKNEPIKRVDPKGLFLTCGSGWSQGLVPDNPMLYPFSDCCRDHDDCYGDCEGPSRTTCDDQFHECMTQKCGRYGGDSQIACKAWADLYYSAVSDWGDFGQRAFQNARLDCKNGKCK
ncbi:MAG: hypothetical protein IPI87_12050 [Betaproteobacteria bacterium]|nr:hypothetical protein [Betaproteobacteria bacterium]